MEDTSGPLAVPPLLRNIAMVLTVGVLFAALYVLVSGPGPPAQVTPLTVFVDQDPTNWSVSFTGVPGGRLPSEMYLLIRDPSRAILLPRTAFANLTLGDWPLNRAVYTDGNPGVLEVRRGDGLRIDRLTYPAESIMEISDRGSLLLVQPLR